MRTTITIIIAILAIALGVSDAAATDYTFNATSGTWGTAANWDPAGGPPGVNDTATIPDGKTCLVEADRSVDSIDIESGGTLRVISASGDARSLAIFDDSTIDGTLKLEGVSSKPASLLIAGTAARRLDGTGTIEGVTPGIGLGTVLYQALCDDASCKLTIPDLTITGTVSIWTNLDFNGTVLVDDADDTIQIGHSSCATASISVSGGPSYEVEAGNLVFECVESIITLNGEPSWTMSGGEITVTDDCSGCAEAVGDFVITGGVLDVDADLCTGGTLDYRGPAAGGVATIDVASGVSATFAGSCG